MNERHDGGACTTLRFPQGLPQIAAPCWCSLVNWLVFRDFFALRLQDGRFFGSLIDVLNRGAPVAMLALGMTLVIATRGIDLSVGAVMAIAGAMAAASTAQDIRLPVALAAALGVGLLCGLWNGILVAVLEIQPFVATLILMVAGRGIAQLITEGQIVTFVSERFAAIGRWILSDVADAGGDRFRDAARDTLVVRGLPPLDCSSRPSAAMSEPAPMPASARRP